MNTNIRLRVRLDGKWTNSNPIKSVAGTSYTVVIERGFESAQIIDSTGTVKANVTGNSTADDVLQALKNYLITNLDCRFVVDNSTPYTKVTAVSAGAAAYVMTASNPGQSGNLTFASNGNVTAPIAGNKILAASIVQAAIRALPGLESITVARRGISNILDITMTGANGLELTIDSNTVLDSLGAPVTITLDPA